MTICNSPSPANTRGHLGAMCLSLKLGRSSLILASLVLAAAITLPRAAFAAPAGTTVGPLPTLTRTGGKDPTINFTFNIGGNIGSGTLQATNLGGGQFQATSGTLTMTGGVDANNTYCLVPTGAPPGQVVTSPLGLFIYDDLLQPAMNPAFPDIYGLLFSNTALQCGTGFTGNDEINIWAGTQSGDNKIPGQYSFYDGHGNGGGYLPAYTTPAGVTDSFTGTVVSTTYAYSGNAFNRFECPTSPAPVDCATPGAGNPYGTKNSVTAVLQTAVSLPASTTENVLCDPNFVSLTLNDGVNTISFNTPCAALATSVAGAAAWVTTDSSGNITAWYLDAYLPATGGPVTEDIHTLYDPSGVIASSPCGPCYGSDDPQGEDKGTQGSYYGYVLNSRGSFIPGGQGGATTAGNCTPASPCQNSPVASTVVVTMAGNGPPPPNDLIIETSYYIPADPRGPNCGYNGTTGQPTSILLSNVPVQRYYGDPNPPTLVSSLGAEVIPWNICIPNGGAWVDLAIDEQLAAVNGLNAYPSFVVPTPPQGVPPANVVACPTSFTPRIGYTGQLTVSAPRAASLTEEQQPEQVGNNGVGKGNGIGPPVFTPAAGKCDSISGSGRPARSLTLFNVQFIAPNPLSTVPVSGTATNQQILVNDITNQYYYLRNGLLPLINFTGKVGQTALASLQACYVRAQSLTSAGNYNCAAYQTYQCDQILKGTPVAAVGPSYSVLRLPDPWGDLHSRHLNLGFLLNAAAGNDTRVSLDDPNVVFPGSSSCPTH